MVLLLENLKFCKGIEVNEENAQNDPEKWCTILDKAVQIRSRSKSCYNILTFTGTNDHCNVCAKIGKNAMKRKHKDQENESIPILKDHANEPVNINQEKIVTEAIDDIINNGAPEKFRTSLKSQIENCKNGMDKRQRRCDADIISLCLSLYVRSPAALEELRSSSMLVLPSVKLLQLYKNF